MDGTGLLYKEFQQALSNQNIQLITLNYPTDQALDQKALLNHLKPSLLSQQKPIWLIGESFGGHLAYLLAQQHPEKVAGIILVASFLTPPSILLKLTPTFFIRITWFMLKKVSLLRKLTMSVLLNRNCSEETKESFAKAINVVNSNVFSARFKQTKQLYLQPDLNHCHYLKPTQDTLISNKAIHQLTQFFNETHCYPIKGTHFLLQTNPQKCAEVISSIVIHETNSV